MKTYIMISLACCMLTLLGGCASVIYTDHQEPGYQLPGAIGTIPLDGSYQLFVRTVKTHVDQSPGKKSAIRSLKVKEPEQEEYADPNDKLIEIEYLFISYKNLTAIYISTVADRHMERYSDPGFLGITKPNVADFRVFLIGAVDSKNHEKITFYNPDKKHTDTWYLTKGNRGDQLLHEIEQKRFDSYEGDFPLEDALHKKLWFNEEKNWRIVLFEKNNPKLQDTTKRLLNNAILFAKPEKNSFMVGFGFEGHVITFPKKYMIYSPERIIKAAN